MKKKILSILLALSIIVVYSVPSYAASPTVFNAVNLTDIGNIVCNLFTNSFTGNEETNNTSLDVELNTTCGDNTVNDTIFAPEGSEEIEEVLEEQGISIDVLDENTYVFTEDEEEIVFSIDDDNESTVLSLSGDSSTNDGYFEFDKNTNTIYSSYTDETIPAEALIEDDTSNIISNYELTTIPKNKTVKISYESLSTLVSSASSAYAIAAAILCIVTAVIGVTITTGPAIIVAMIPFLLSAIRDGLDNKNGGLKISLTRVKVTMHHKGQTVTTYCYKVSRISQYS